MATTYSVALLKAIVSVAAPAYSFAPSSLPLGGFCVAMPRARSRSCGQKPARGKSRGKKMQIQQLTVDEQSQIDNVMRKEDGSATDALRRINEERRKKKIREVHRSSVFRYAQGLSHKRGAVEKRGRKRSLSKQDVRKLDQTRRRLIRQAENEKRVTYEDVVEEAGLSHSPSQRVCEDALRGEGVGFKAPRRKIYVSDDDAKKRWAVAKVWAKRPASFWSKSVHAYVDNKAFPIPLTQKQRKKFRQGMVTGHLRKPSEGIDRGFTKPREKHSFIGIPSVTISAAVAKDRVIMWHVVPGSWNGATAASMYEDKLKPALVRAWGKRSRYTIVEDGDRKGNTSGKGVAAKARAKIYAMTLPPRTPSLMPLDYSVWQVIVKKMIDGAPRGAESKEAFLNRLRAIATSLPKGYVKSVIRRMRGNLKALVEARGYTPKGD